MELYWKLLPHVNDRLDDPLLHSPSEGFVRGCKAKVELLVVGCHRGQSVVGEEYPEEVSEDLRGRLMEQVTPFGHSFVESPHRRQQVLRLPFIVLNTA